MTEEYIKVVNGVPQGMTQEEIDARIAEEALAAEEDE
jgi:hypothetical protein